MCKSGINKECVMKNKWIHIIWILCALFWVGCEDLEDTYDEYAGDGMIRYVGKCSNLEVQSGWNRLKVKWKGNLDAAIDKVKITWQAESDAEPHVRYVEPLRAAETDNFMDSIYLEGLSDAVYTITVSNVSVDSVESIAETAYARPYTASHEDLRTFTRGIVNFYVLGDKLAVFLDEDNENLKEVKLVFQGTDGEEHIWDIKEHMNLSVDWFDMVREYAFLLPEEEGVGIDFTQPVVVKRRGNLEGCIDEITFEDMELPLDEEVWSASFSQWFVKNYGERTDEVINSIETIELDYDVTTMQDLCYFPNLKKVILGKNRYMLDGYTDINVSTTDAYKGLMTLQFLKEMRGITVERYNQHYFGDIMGSPYIDFLAAYGKIDADLVTEKGNSNLTEMPVVEPLDTTGWVVTCSDTLYNGYKENGAAYLLDDNSQTYFEPGLTSSAQVIEVEFDMQEPTLIHGFKVVQPAPETQTDLEYLLASVKIEVSDNSIVWEDATYETGGILIGDAPGESSFIYIPEVLQRPVRYVRLTMANRQVNATSEGTILFSLRLADVIPF